MNLKITKIHLLNAPHIYHPDTVLDMNNPQVQDVLNAMCRRAKSWQEWPKIIIVEVEDTDAGNPIRQENIGEGEKEERSIFPTE